MRALTGAIILLTSVIAIVGSEVAGAIWTLAFRKTPPIRGATTLQRLARGPFSLPNGMCRSSRLPDRRHSDLCGLAPGQIGRLTTAT
jgi:hypothetical protein